MSKDNTCDTCKYWDAMGERQDAALGYCKKLAPGEYISIAYNGTPGHIGIDSFVTCYDFGCNQWEEYE
jgi:hypothetical protein